MPKTSTKSRNTNRRKFLSGALLAAAGGSFAVLPSASAQTAKKGNTKRTGVYPKEAPAAVVGYSPGLIAEGGKVICVSGQGPHDLKADMESQIRETFKKIDAILKAAGASMENVIMMRAYFVNMKRDLPIFRKVRKEFLVEPYPASTAVGTTELAVPGLEIEIEATAIL